MAPPDGSRAPRIPTLSWESVVRTGDRPSTLDDGVPASAPATPAVSDDSTPPAVPAPPAPPVAPEATAVEAEPPVPEPAPTTIDSGSPSIEPDPPSIEPEPTATEDASPTSEQASPATEPEPVRIRTTPPVAIVPALGDVTSGPDTLAPDTDVLPQIREATPVPQNDAPAIGPQLPAVQAPVPQPVAASQFAFDAASLTSPPTRQTSRRRGGGGLKLLVTLVLLGGLVAAGFVFGRPYLFPTGWDETTAPYADAVESVRGTEFTEPLSIVAEPSARFAERLQSQLAAPSPEELAAWRALGLASGVVDEAALAQLLAGWQDALYAADDGQVYHDQGVAGAELDAQLVQAMAAAALDQEFGWSSEQPGRTLDAAAATAAEVLRQARTIQVDSGVGGAVDPVPTAQVPPLPPVIGYSLLAPHVFSELPTDAPATPNVLAGLGSNGPGPLGDDQPVPAAAASPLDGDVVVGSPVARDRSFWFLVFGSLLDGPTAFAASEAIVENSLTHAERGTTDCVYATFSGGGVEQTETLRAALAAWAAAAPQEFESSFSTLADGSLQLSSCDPGAGFATPVRTSVVAELIAYRTLELATAAAVVEAGGGDPEFAYVWGLIGASDMPNDVAGLPTGTPPSEIAAAATEAVDALYRLAG